MVVRDGRVIAERYAPGYGIDTQVMGWSATKSVTNALIGILVRQGKLSLDRPRADRRLGRTRRIRAMPSPSTTCCA